MTGDTCIDTMLRRWKWNGGDALMAGLPNRRLVHQLTVDNHVLDRNRIEIESISIVLFPLDKQ